MPSLNVVFEVPKSRSTKTKGTSHFTRSGWRTAISSRILKPRGAIASVITSRRNKKKPLIGS